MARRRLSPLPADADVPRAEHSGPTPPPAAPGRLEAEAFAPIARVAAEAAGAAAFDEMAETLRRARAEGRLVLDLPLDAVVSDHLARDRIAGADGEMAALIASIRRHGQRTPIEVTALPEPGRFGLISGSRRLAALETLQTETGEPRFATVRALIHRPATAQDAYVAMVEENEVRAGLSYYERARVAAIAAERGVFSSEKKALLALFATASRPKRSRIRAFLDIYHALDGVLRFPQALPERLGLKLVEVVRNGGKPRIAEAVAEANPATPEAELALLERLVRPHARAPETPGLELRPGLVLAERLTGHMLTLTLRGRAVTPELRDAVRAALVRLGAEI
jgi:ParB family chromosome partitioning protein